MRNKQKVFKFCNSLLLVDQIFNDLLVKRRTTERQNGHVIYECKCVCGRITRVRATRLINNITKSCGKCQRRIGTPNIMSFNGDN